MADLDRVGQHGTVGIPEGTCLAYVVSCAAIDAVLSLYRLIMYRPIPMLDSGLKVV